ncbi:hypothetical protein [Coxiella-like endosymbiont]|uniref:hypothetical protein n=1 Tax=Coxiella-like endosymbiont TaxID=1592897 RepID=UPI002868AFB1|nr:hypothetical protein [Coxiella-like endosymbiont]
MNSIVLKESIAKKMIKITPNSFKRKNRAPGLKIYIVGGWGVGGGWCVQYSVRLMILLYSVVFYTIY